MTPGGDGSGAPLRVEVNVEPTSRALRSVLDGLRNREPINRKISIQLYGWVLKNFNSGGSNQTPRWAPLKPSTLRQKKRLGYSSQPLLRTGNLRQSFMPFADNDEAGVGARASFGVDYAAVHETGTKDGRIPARPMLPSIDTARKLAIQVYNVELSALKGRAGL